MDGIETSSRLPQNTDTDQSGRKIDWAALATRVLPALLRPYQREAVSSVLAEFARGIPATLIELAPGLGKTVIASAIIKLVVEGGGRVLFVAHRAELLDQAQRTLAKYSVEAHIALGKAAAPAGARVVLSTVQTFSKRCKSYPIDTFDLLVIDEAHHATAKTYRRVIDHFHGARVLGLTATPDRADGARLVGGV